MPDADVHRLAQRLKRMRRNEGRRRRRANPILLNWTPERARRCVSCGRYLAVGAEAGHGLGFRICEPCHAGLEWRRASFRALASARAVALSGAA